MVESLAMDVKFDFLREREREREREKEEQRKLLALEIDYLRSARMSRLQKSQTSPFGAKCNQNQF